MKHKFANLLKQTKHKFANLLKERATDVFVANRYTGHVHEWDSKPLQRQ